QEIFDALKKKIGMVPNLYATAANSPAALKGILAFGDSLRRGEFSKKEIEAVALAISQENGCEYCLAAHTAVGKMVGFSEDETLALRDGSIGDTKLNALTKLAKNITVTAGYPSQELIAGFFEVGYTKAALVELIGHVALNVFNNYLNHIADTPIDFPEAKKLIQKQSA
ncbi:MAG: carboxymuconolactone decarboxylase family protein, partial [Candidatus Dadabacteria bacterium]|nr:carboxymuconolactone decarboxylase family protein [Candidatus Dadabacteria bacterium]